MIQGAFKMIIPYMCTVHLEQVHPFCYISIPCLSFPHLFKQCLVGFITLTSYDLKNLS
jgi:hypothetical protein